MTSEFYTIKVLFFTGLALAMESFFLKTSGSAFIGHFGKESDWDCANAPTENKNINWEIPILFRYNISTYFGVGAGAQINMNISEKQTQNIKTDIYEGASDKLLLQTVYSTETNSNTFSGLNSGLLLDFTAGFARIGPSFGARYVLNFDNNFNYYQLYAIWKF